MSASRALEFAPVETVTADALRQRAIGILFARHADLSARKGQYDFTEIERQHLWAIEQSLRDLAALAPDGPLIPAPDRRVPTFE